ncbi:recombinase family protein [Enterobacter sp. RHBSTW-00975]|uniref:recombinase family protein n=1 Tax=Enterobacter sp. RHBSTW-00975 TaxID=2742673 RepID=UPI0015E53ACB|nr:recombinase family protein [Enterobacter sp. RHBSTW-00975]QLO88689.1 recombinase family protein [Enterobacter sp. RHBSTW-00975]
MLRPICYERVSTIYQAVMANGLDDQRSSLTAYLDRNAGKFSTDRIFIQDAGLSAYKNANISATSNLGKFLQDVRDRKYGKGDALIVISLDRLSRRSSWAESTIQFIVNSGIEIHDISTNLVLREDDPMSKIHMELIQHRSHNESLMKSVRAKLAWDNKILRALQNGEVISNRMPNWLKNVDNKYQVIPEQAELIVKCLEWYREGLSTGEIVKRIGKKWQMVTVSRLIRDRRLLGEHERYNGEVVPNVYPKIIDEDLFLTANRMMDRVMLEKKKPAEDLLLEPDVVREIFKLYESGLGSGAIVKRLPKGWSTVNVLRVLRDKKVVTMKIIDNLTFERVNEKLSRNGIANRIRKDITIAQDDYITNLFPKILKCGNCGGNIAIHYNHVRTKYVICRNREEKKICDAKSFQYTRIEKNILQLVKNIDFNKLMMEGQSDSDLLLASLREELSTLKKEEETYQIKINERKVAGKKTSLPLMTGLTEVQDRIEEIESDILNAKNIKEIPVFDFDINKVLDPMNVELRAKLRKELRLVLKSVKYWIFGKRIFVQLEYFNEILSHVLVIDNKRGGGEVLHEIVISESNGERVYTVNEEGKTVFIASVTSGTDMWSLAISRTKTLDDVGLYLNLLNRENFEILVNEDLIDWID